jgi:hypothetical protein
MGNLTNAFRQRIHSPLGPKMLLDAAATDWSFTVGGLVRKIPGPDFL